MEYKQLLKLQKDVYKLMQANGLALSDIIYHNTSTQQKEAIYKAINCLLKKPVDNSKSKRVKAI